MYNFLRTTSLILAVYNFFFNKIFHTLYYYIRGMIYPRESAVIWFSDFTITSAL